MVCTRSSANFRGKRRRIGLEHLNYVHPLADLYQPAPLADSRPNAAPTTAGLPIGGLVRRNGPNFWWGKPVAFAAAAEPVWSDFALGMPERSAR